MGEIFIFFMMIAVFLVPGFLTILFWGDEYTTRHCSRIRRVLCGSHLRSFVSLVAVPWDLLLVLGAWLDPYVREMVIGDSNPIVGIIFFGAALLGTNYGFYYFYILSEHSFKNGFYRNKVATIIEIYEKEHRLDRDVLEDYIESMFFATQRHNTIAEQVLQSLVDREDELGTQARTILHMLQAKYSDAEASKATTE